MADLNTFFLPYWHYLRPSGFVVMIVVWIWALWIREPNAPINPLRPQLEKIPQKLANSL